MAICNNIPPINHLSTCSRIDDEIFITEKRSDGPDILREFGGRKIDSFGVICNEIETEDDGSVYYRFTQIGGPIKVQHLIKTIGCVCFVEVGTECAIHVLTK